MGSEEIRTGELCVFIMVTTPLNPIAPDMFKAGEKNFRTMCKVCFYLRSFCSKTFSK